MYARHSHCVPCLGCVQAEGELGASLLAQFQRLQAEHPRAVQLSGAALLVLLGA